MLQRYSNQYIVNPVSELEVYCRMEGVSPLFVRRIEKKEKGQLKPRRAVK